MENQNKAVNLAEDTPLQERINVAENYYVAMLEYYIHLARRRMAVEGVEMDVHRLMYEYRKDLKFSQAEALLALKHVGTNFNRLDELLMPLIDDPNLTILARDLRHYSGQVKNLYSELEQLKKIIAQKMVELVEWYNTQKKTLSESK